MPDWYCAIDGVANVQVLKRGEDAVVLVADHHEHIIETGRET